MSQQGNGTSSSWSVRNQKRKKEIIFQHRLESPTSAFANSLLKIGSSMEKIKREEKEILMKAKGREMESSVPFIRDKWLKWIFFLIFFSFFAPLFLSLLLLLLFPFSSSLSTQPLLEWLILGREKRNYSLLSSRGWSRVSLGSTRAPPLALISKQPS